MAVNLKDFLYLYEQQEKTSEVTDFIIKKYSQDDIDDMIEEKILEYVPSNWEEDGDYENEAEWYNENGKGEAENDVAVEVIQNAARKKKIKLTQSEFADLQNWFFNVYNF